MKKFRVSAAALMMSGIILFSSCIGSFGLFNKVLSWNEGATDSKFVNEVIFLAMYIVPVYEISMFVDVVVLNSIEFWTGSNPVANAGDVKQVKGEKGVYAVTTNENGYTVSNEQNESIDFVFDENTQTWSVVSDGQASKLLQLNKEEGTAEMFLQNGETMLITMDEQGMMAARYAIMGDCFAQK